MPFAFLVANASKDLPQKTYNQDGDITSHMACSNEFTHKNAFEKLSQKEQKAKRREGVWRAAVMEEDEADNVDNIEIVPECVEVTSDAQGLTSEKVSVPTPLLCYAKGCGREPGCTNGAQTVATAGNPQNCACH